MLKPFDFQLVIERTQRKGYRVRVRERAAGERGEERLQLDPATLFGLGPALRCESLRQMQRPAVATGDEARRLGGQLFEKVFRGSVRTCYETSLARATEQGLRVELRFDDVPELVALPWELLYDTRRNQFLARSKANSLVRHLRAEAGTRFAISGRLKVLVVVASPEGLAPLDAEGEWKRISEALAPAVRQRKVILGQVLHATLNKVRARLRQEEWHVLHFIGHGDFSAHWGALLLEDEQGHQDRVKADRLRDLICGCGLQLVVLNVCEGGRGSQTEDSLGLAQGLAHAGIPALVAMQQAVADDAAISFSHVFYEELAKGQTLEAALTEARLELASKSASLAWANPVLYMTGPSAGLVPALTGWRAFLTSNLVAQLRAQTKRLLRPWLIGPLLLASVGGGVAWITHQRPASVAEPAAVPSTSGTGQDRSLTAAPAAPLTSADSSSSTTQTPPGEEMVWVNTSSKGKVFHRKGSHWYNNTKQGQLMTEAEALKRGYREAK